MKKPLSIFRTWKGLITKDGKNPLPTPTVLMQFDERKLVKLNRKMSKGDESAKVINFYDYFWFEVERFATLCYFTPEDYMLSIIVVRPDGSFGETFNCRVDNEGLADRETKITQNQNAFLTIVLFACYLTTKATDEKYSVFTDTRMKASLYEKRGDEAKLVRVGRPTIRPSDQYQAPEPGASGIKKREHDVREHYRRYKNGAVVRVKPHKRGDPTLGKIIKVFT